MGGILLLKGLLEQIGEAGFIRLLLRLLQFLNMAAHLAEAILDLAIQLLQPGAELI